MSLKLPEWMINGNYSWLTEEYITEHGRYPEKPDIFDTLDEEKRFKELYFGEIPLISTDDIEEGDILVFFDCDGEDVFYRFNENDMAEYKNEQRGFLAHGVIVKPPVTGDET